MKTAVYFCNCGTNISERVDFAVLQSALLQDPDVAYVTAVDFPCSEDGRQSLTTDLRQKRPDRVVIAACSPREYERAFMAVLQGADINPYLLQMANIREQVAWVTPDPKEATAKACAQIRGAVARVAHQEPLERREVEACRDVVVIGAGPAGLKAALALAEAGRKVTLVEKSPALGGLPVRYEELFPNMECGPCMLEPVLGDVLHGPHAAQLEVLTLAEITSIKGYYGNFAVNIRQAPRYVDTAACIGCSECIPPCPASAPNPFNFELDRRNAISLPYLGALPNAPFLDFAACLRSAGADCTLCRDACPVEGVIRFDDAVRTLERPAGAIVVAIGGGHHSPPAFGHGDIPGVYTSLEFERLLAANGPTAGEIQAATIAIVHCAGSLDGAIPYCSGVCCQYAFKFNHLIERKLPGAKIHHLYKELVVPGKEEFTLYQHAKQNPNATFTRYDALTITEDAGKPRIDYGDGTATADMVVLCTAMTGAADAGELSRILDTPVDSFGFFEELHGRSDAARSKIQGIYLAGACQGPMDIQRAVSQGMSAAGYILAGLADGRKLEIEPITASVDEERCSTCRTCGAVCPYHAIGYVPDNGVASVNALLCHGCGTCVAACASGAMQGCHFTDRQIMAEIEAVLR